MKSIKKMYWMTAIVAICSFTALGYSGESNAVKKAKEAVKEAEAYDWRTLAESAQVCFDKKENVGQALEWIDRSIEINKDPFNLEVKGDYYRSIGDNKKAMRLYYEAITVGKSQNFWFESSKIQGKIWDLREG